MTQRFYVPENSTVRIAISGRSGCGNTTVSRLLAEKLDIAFINFTFRTLAQDLHVPLADIIEKAKHDFSYDRMVDTKQVELAGQGSCVLGSRLAIWMLPDANLKVYLTASEDTRTKRIMNREGGDFTETKQFTLMRDEEDTRRYRELYNIDNTDYSCADLVIDTEAYGPEAIVEAISEQLAEKGLVKRE